MFRLAVYMHGVVNISIPLVPETLCTILLRVLTRVACVGGEEDDSTAFSIASLIWLMWQKVLKPAFVANELKYLTYMEDKYTYVIIRHLITICM